MTLYEIDTRLTELIDPETGELLDYNAFQNLQMEREEKIEGIALWHKELAAKAEAIKAEISVLTQRKQAAERKSETLKRYLAEALNGEKFDTARCAITFRRTSRLDISDESALAAWAMESGHNDLLIYTPPKVSKSEVKALIKSGVEVPQAQIVESISMGVK